jgi:hypothetical protein
MTRSVRAGRDVDVDLPGGFVHRADRRFTSTCDDAGDDEDEAGNYKPRHFRVSDR